MSPNRRVVVVGTGVIGLTTAIVLELVGHPTRIVTDGRDRANLRPPPSDVASLHAAASILPHSVRGVRAPAWTTVTARVLDTLVDRPGWGVRVQTHMELFESADQPLPGYGEALDDLVVIGPSTSPAPPQRGGDTPVSGWSFAARFCDGQLYLERLADLYVRMGGEMVSTSQVAAPALVRAGAQHIVNCTGHGGPSFAAAAEGTDIGADLGLDPLRDLYSARFIIGHYLRVRFDHLLHDPTGRVLSYNYTPPAHVYSTADGGPADVYCYPRSDAWLLGGSRIPVDGSVEDADRLARAGRGDTVLLPDARGHPLAVPRAILDLNHSLLATYTAGRTDLKARVAADARHAWVGYGLRAERSDPVESTRVGCSALLVDGLPAIIGHNYGHGGSGFALSWGTAIELVRRMRAAAGRGGIDDLPTHEDHVEPPDVHSLGRCVRLSVLGP